MKRKINFLDLFSGIGGFRKGFEEAGFTLAWEGHSEIDKYAKSVYKNHFKGSEDLGDVREIKVKYEDGFTTITAGAIQGRVREICFEGRIDVITLGSPCQDVSVAGKRRGILAERSGLFFEAIRIIRGAKPRYIFFENVKGILSSNKGEDFLTVLKAFADIGYDCQWQVCNTRWVLPQNRERLFLIGYPFKECPPKIFPFTERDFRSGETQGKTQRQGKWIRGNNSQDQDQVADALQERDYKGGQLLQIAQVGEKDSEATRVYSTDGDSRTIKNGGGMGAKTGLYAVPMKWRRSEKGKQARRESIKKGVDRTPFSDGCRELVPADDSSAIGCITNSLNKDSLLSVDSAIRRLTPVECERLQGFPDGWTEQLSDTQRYKSLGNAVTVDMIQIIAERLSKYLT